MTHVMYTPTASTKELRRYHVLSQTSIKTIKIKPRVKVINDNVLIPRLRPRRTDIIAIEVIIQMIPVCVF